MTRKLQFSPTATIDDLPSLPEDCNGVRYAHIPGFFGYAAGTDGSIWTAYRQGHKSTIYSCGWARKSAKPARSGHLAVSVKGDDGRFRNEMAHRLVLFAFVGPPPKGTECRHLNGNHRDNRIENLKWGTRKENVEDARRHGTISRGERNGQAKLTELRVRAVRDLLSAGWTQDQVAECFGVGQVTIFHIVHNNTWKHLL